MARTPTCGVTRGERAGRAPTIRRNDDRTPVDVSASGSASVHTLTPTSAVDVSGLYITATGSERPETLAEAPEMASATTGASAPPTRSPGNSAGAHGKLMCAQREAHVCTRKLMCVHVCVRRKLMCAHGKLMCVRGKLMCVCVCVRGKLTWEAHVCTWEAHVCAWEAHVCAWEAHVCAGKACVRVGRSCVCVWEAHVCACGGAYWSPIGL